MDSQTAAPCVWYVSKYVITPTAGDPAGRDLSLMREFARQGCRALVVTSDSMGKFNAPLAREQYAMEEYDGVSVCRVRTLKYSDSKSTRRILSWLDFERRLLRLPKNRLPAPDVVVVSSLSLLTVLNGFLLRRRYRCRLVFEVRDIWPLTIVEEGGFSRWNPLVLLLGAIERAGYRRADAIVGTMPNLGAHVEEVTGQSLPTHCIPMGIDPGARQSSPPLPADYAAAYIPTDRFIVAYAGSIGISNAMDVLLQCAESMRNDPRVHFVVLGEGELRESYIQQYGILPNLTFAPRIPKSQVYDFLTRCDLLYFSVHTSKVWEYGLSLNKLIDYMFAAKPIVASYSGYPSMINEADCGTFVPAGDVGALRNEIIRYAAMPSNERTVIGERGRNWLVEHRDFRVLAESYLDILLPSHPPAPTSVLHLTHTSVPQDARILRELNALSASDEFDVHAFGVIDAETPRAPTRYALREFHARSAAASFLPRPIRYTLVMLEVNTRFVSRLMRLRPDIVHCHDTMVLPAGVFAKLVLRSTLVYDAHELESDKAGQGPGLSKATLLIERLAWPRIDRLITVSPSIGAWYSKHLGPKPTTCILNSPQISDDDVTAHGTLDSDLRDQLNLAPEVPLFVYVGAQEPGRGIELLLDAFSAADTDVHVAFVGDGSLRTTIEDAARTHENLHHCPPIPHDELVPYIARANGGFCLIEDISLSDHYCLPNKLFEYAFAGLPVIASRLPDIQRLIDDYQLGVCADLNISSIRQAASECLAAQRNLPPERLTPLSWNIQAANLRTLYGKIRGPQRHPSPPTDEHLSSGFSLK